jgi:TPR repeat protein/serine/threonine protein kinase
VSPFPCPFCDAPLAAEAAGPPSVCGACGRQLRVCGGYRVTGLLGRGGMGAVFSGYREADRQPVAIKVLVPRTPSDWTSWELFERSTQVLQGLRHPALPAVHAFERAEPARLILVREAFDGGTLEEWICARDARLSTEAVAWLLEALLQLLAYLESRVPPVVHRDIKPANIMFRTAADWSPVLVDFDTIAAPEGLGSGLTIVGTPGYAAPEQFAGDASPASDLYSLGATLLFVVTHVDADKLPRDHGRFALGDRLAGLPERLRTVLLRMVEPDRAARYPGAAAALAALHAPIPVAAPPGTPPASRARERSPAELLARLTMVDEGDRPTVERAAQPAPAATAWAPGLTPPTLVDDRAEVEAVRKKRYSLDTVIGWIGIALGVLAVPATIVIIIAVQNPTPPTPRVATPPPSPATPSLSSWEKCQRGDARVCDDTGGFHDRKSRYSQALPFFQKGCELGNGCACNDLGRYHERGNSVKRDAERAIEFYGRACRLDHATGCVNQAVMLRSGPTVVQDLKGAFAADRRACDLGSEKGCFDLGVALHEGRGAPVDFQASLAAYRRACDRKHPRACRNLGLMTDAGEGVTRDPAAAATLFTQACDLGEKDGCVNLARALAAGRGVSADAERAATLVRGQCREGHQASCDLFKKLKPPSP